MLHDLKTWPVPFAAVLDGSKTHEVRSNTDRFFAVGDTLRLREWIRPAERYTGREVFVNVTYISQGPDWGLPVGVCVMSIRLA